MVGRPVTAPRSIPKFAPELFSPPRFFGDPEVASDNLQTMEARNWVAEVDVVNDEPLRRFRHLASLCWLGWPRKTPSRLLQRTFLPLFPLTSARKGRMWPRSSRHRLVALAG